MTGIYKITNPKGKIYIGQSKDIDSRIKNYSSLKCISQRKLYNSIKKYGWDKHLFEVICECDLSELDKLECYYIDLYLSVDVGLNLRHGGNRAKMSDETKFKMSMAHKGEKNIMFGKTHSIEAKNKISKTHKGRRLSKERIEQIRKTNTGRVKSLQEIEKIRASKIGIKRPEWLKNYLSKIKSKRFAISNDCLLMEFESVTSAAEYLKCSRKEISKYFKNNLESYKGFKLMYI